MTLQLLELLYAPTSAVSGRAYDKQTVRDYERLTEHIDKKQLGRSYKYGLIVDDRERRKRERKQMAIQTRMERQQMESMELENELAQSPQEGLGYTLIPQDVGQAAQRLNLLCGSVAAGNDNRMLKNEISMICDHLYKQKVLSKPETKKLIKKYCM